MKWFMQGAGAIIFVMVVGIIVAIVIRPETAGQADKGRAVAVEKVITEIHGSRDSVISVIREE